MIAASLIALADAGTNLAASPSASPAAVGNRGVDAVDLFRLVGYGCLLVWALWWLGRRLGKWPSLHRLVQAQGALRVVESRSLGFRCHVHLVACGEQRFLVGSSPTGVHLVSEVADPHAPGADPGFRAAYERAGSPGSHP